MSLLEKRITVLEGLLASSETNALDTTGNASIEIKTTGEVSVSGNVNPDDKVEEKAVANGTKSSAEDKDKVSDEILQPTTNIFSTHIR
jgi:hypothetical protein